MNTSKIISAYDLGDEEDFDDEGQKILSTMSLMKKTNEFK